MKFSNTPQHTFSGIMYIRMLMFCTLLLALMVVPTVGAVHNGGFEDIAVSEYIVAEHQVSLQDPGTGTVNSELIDVGKRHNYEVHNATLGFRASITVSFISNSNGVWNLTFLVNDTIASGCQLLINTVNPGVLANDILVYPYYETFCFIDELPGNNINSTTLPKQINTTLQVQSGNPAVIETLNIDLAFLRTDEYMVSQDVLVTGLELGTTSTLNVLVILVMVFLGIMLWSRSGDFLVELAGAFLVLIAGLVTLSFIGHWKPMIFVTTLTLLLGLWMLLKSFLEVIIDKKQVNL